MDENPSGVRISPSPQKMSKFMRITQNLLFFLLLSLLFTQQDDKIAEIYFVDGDCLIENNYINNYSKKALSGRALYNGDFIKTKENSFCSVRFLDDKTNVDLGPSSSFQIFDKKNTREIFINRGSVYIKNITSRTKKVYAYTNDNHIFINRDRVWVESDNLNGDLFITLDNEIDMYNVNSKTQKTLSPNLLYSVSLDGILLEKNDLSFLPSYIVSDIEKKSIHNYAINLNEDDLIPIYGRRVYGANLVSPYSLSFSFGANVVDDTNYFKIAVYPSYRRNNLFIGFKLESYINPNGNNISNDWDDFFDLFDKTTATYQNINNKNEMYFHFGQNSPEISFGQGYLLNNLNRSINQPKIKNSGIYLKYVFDKNFMDLNVIIPDIREFSNSGGVIGVRTSLFISNKFPLTLGLGIVADLNQFSFLSDRINKNIKKNRKVYGLEFDFNYDLISDVDFEASLFGEFVGIWYPNYNYYLLFNDNNFQNDLKWRRGSWGIKAPGFKLSFGNRYQMKFALNFNSATFIPGYFDATYSFNKVRYYKNNNLAFPLVQQQINLIQENFSVDGSTDEFLIPKDVYPILFENDGFSPHKVYGVTSEHIYAIHKYVDISIMGSLFIEDSDDSNAFYSMETSIKIKDKFIRNLSFLDIFYSNSYFDDFSDQERMILGLKAGIELPFRLNLIINLSQLYYDSNLADNLIDSMFNAGIDIKYNF